MLRGIFQFARVRQTLWIEDTAPRFVGPAPDADIDFPAHVAPPRQTCSRNGVKSSVGRTPLASCAIASPSAAECLKPWPEQGDARMTRGASGSSSTMKRA